MSNVSFFVPCEPVPQPRVKVSTRGGFARAYVDAKHPIHALKQAIRDAFGSHDKLNGPIGCSLIFLFTRPKSHTKKQRQCGWHTGKGDIDNLVKAVLDSLNGIAFDDDKQVAFVTAYKRWVGDKQKPGICVQFWEME